MIDLFVFQAPNTDDIERQIFGRDVDLANFGQIFIKLVRDVFGSDGYSGPAWTFLFGTAALIGVWRVFMGVRGLARQGQAPPYHAGHDEGAAIFANILGGAALISLYSIVTVGTESLFGEVSPLTYEVSASSTVTLETTINAIFRIIQWVGIFAVFKAIRLWQQGASGLRPHDGASPAVYLISGVLAFNLQRVFALIAGSAA